MQAMNRSETYTKIRGFDLFKDVPDNQLAWLVDQADIRQYRDGDLVFRPGDPIENTLVVLEGEFGLYAVSEKQEREITTKSAGEVSGFLPFSRGRNASGTGRVKGNTTLLQLHRSFEREMLRDHYELSQVFVHEMTSRVREFTTFQKQTEKMAALGKLSAGLAHELNNPASAIVRSSMELKKHLGLQPEKFKKVIQIKLDLAQIDEINRLIFKKINDPAPPLKLLERKAREDDLGFLLEDYGITDAFDLAVTLVDNGFTESEIQGIIDLLGKSDVGPVLHWIEDNLLLEKMVQDIQESSHRISTLVGAVKRYTHMDQAPEKSMADIHNGLTTTLNILNHKINQLGIKLVLEFDEAIPNIPLYLSEINQVWTNLLDNALDAAGEVANPTVTLKTSLHEKTVTVCICDNGKGIPQEIAGRIWEPFYTTKAQGKGTGLGLELVQQIVDKHQGTIKMKSQPGSTTFEVKLTIS